jgi:uncharacterized protein (DUF433 family)
MNNDLAGEPRQGTVESTAEENDVLGFDRITFDPQIMGGRACIRGMRVTVSLVLNLAANGMSVEEIVRAYPYVEPEDVAQALQYAAWLAR